MSAINYNVPAQVAYKGSTSLKTAEATLVTVSLAEYLRKSQFTVYINTAIPGGGSVVFKYYYSPDNGTTWFMIPIKDSSSGILVSTPSKVDATSPTQDSGTSYKVIDNIAVGAATQFKVTAATSASTATLNSLTILARDN